MTLPKIQENSRYIAEVQKFSASIDKIENEKIKLEAMDVLDKLIKEVKYLDRLQETIFYSKQNRTSLEDSKSNIISYRKKLEKLTNRYSN